MESIKKAFVRFSFTLRKVMLCVVYTMILSCLPLNDAKAAAATVALAAPDSTFTVEKFRQLPTDVSAFIDAVRDLNGEACALLKVVAPADFAFSSPLGIVERRDKVGEIWLFLPKGTKSITLKHPQWGVLRDYKFGTKLESRMTYEMRLRLPQTAVVEKHDTSIYSNHRRHRNCGTAPTHSSASCLHVAYSLATYRWTLVGRNGSLDASSWCLCACEQQSAFVAYDDRFVQ